MKLPRLRRKPPSPETAEPASLGPAAPVLQVVIYPNTDLPEQEFTVQTEKLPRVANYDNVTRSWYGQILFDRPEWLPRCSRPSSTPPARKRGPSYSSMVTKGHYWSRPKIVAVDRDVDRCAGIPSAICAFTGSGARHRCRPGACYG
jgi:hypothetical protein